MRAERESKRETRVELRPGRRTELDAQATPAWARARLDQRGLEGGGALGEGCDVGTHVVQPPSRELLDVAVCTQHAAMRA